MSMQRATVIGLIAALLVLGSVVGPASAFGGEPLTQADVDPDSVNIAIDVREDGSAAWSVEYRVRLETDNETAAFQDIVADVDNNSSAYIDRFSSRIDATVAEAESDTGRTMTATDYTVSAEIRELPQTYGILTYTFVWEGFATTDGDTIRVGDALRGFFLDEETTMLVSWPAEYQVSSVDPAPTDDRENAITWEGPLEFAGDEPSIVLEPSEPTTTQTSETTAGVTSSPSAGTTPGTDGTSDALMYGLVIVGLLILAFLAIWYYRREDEEGGLTNGAESPEDGTASGVPPQPADDTQPEDELLSNEERVTQFLADHGGRAKQQEIVDGLEWTEAKTSQVLTSMADEGTIEKFRIGRENVVKLPDEEN